MHGTSSIDQRLVRYHARFALVEALTGILAAGGRKFSGWLEGIARYQRQEQARGELRALNDRSLKDIGLDRHEIDRLFR